MEELREALGNFAVHARQFLALVATPGPIDRLVFCRELLRILPRLYAAALEVGDVRPIPYESDQSTWRKSVDEMYPVAPEEWEAIRARAEMIIQDRRHYRVQYDPTIRDAVLDDAVVGDLADDMADIFRDVRPLLEAWDSGTAYLPDLKAALGPISLFPTHWGVHVVHSLVGLHFIVFDYGV